MSEIALDEIDEALDYARQTKQNTDDVKVVQYLNKLLDARLEVSE